MTMTMIAQTQFDPAELKGLVRFVTPPSVTGERSFYSDVLGASDVAAGAVLHVNAVAEARLPMTVDKVEHHPHAAQVFIPLDVSRYLVTVMGSNANGQPDLSTLRSVVVPGNVGVIFHPGVWHVGASVLDRPGNFAVLMWRGTENDDVFCAVTPFSVTLNETLGQASAQTGSRG